METQIDERTPEQRKQEVDKLVKLLIENYEKEVLHGNYISPIRRAEFKSFAKFLLGKFGITLKEGK